MRVIDGAGRREGRSAEGVRTRTAVALLPTRRERIFATLARAVMITHLLVSAFILLGGVLVWQGAVAWWFHVAFAAWGVLVHAGNITCPLTPLEKRLRALAGEQPYEHGFVARYLAPRRLGGRSLDWAVVIAVVATNGAIYGLLIH